MDGMSSSGEGNNDSFDDNQLHYDDMELGNGTDNEDMLEMSPNGQDDSYLDQNQLFSQQP